MAVWYVPIITPLPFDAALRRRLRKEHGGARGSGAVSAVAAGMPSRPRCTFRARSPLAERANRASSYGD
jgi:hypothetical protein